MANLCRCPCQRSHSVFFEQCLFTYCVVAVFSSSDLCSQLCLASRHGVATGVELVFALGCVRVCRNVQACPVAECMCVCVYTTAYAYRYLLGMLVSDEGVPLTLAQLPGIIRRMFALAAGCPCSVKACLQRAFRRSDFVHGFARYGSFVHPMHKCAPSVVKLMSSLWAKG